jgi:hypothetical protein
MSGSAPLAETEPARLETPRRWPRDRTDYNHRHFVNLLAAATILAVGLGVIWTVLAIDAYETREKCLASGRRECVQIYTPPRGVRSIATPSVGRP